MTQLIVLRFDNDEEAERFATNVLDYEEVQTGLVEYDTTLVGRFKVPTEKTKTCEHSPEERKETGLDTQSKRGAKFGWWVRRCCGRPAYVSNHMVNNLEPEADPDKLITIHWWNRPWKGRKAGNKT